MPVWLERLTSINVMTLLLALIVIGSVVQGALKGASGSARQLLFLLLEGFVTLLSVLIAWRLAAALSPLVKDWLVSRHIVVPQAELNGFKQTYYTFVTALRDFSLMRTGLLLVLGYMAVKGALNALLRIAFSRFVPFSGAYRGDSAGPSWTSSAAGGAIGALIGFARAIMMIAVLFVYTAMFPHAPLSGYIEDSAAYQKGAKEIVQPVTGNLFSEQLPVFTRAVETELNNILQRKYEVLDAGVHSDIALAAQDITAGAKTDEEKAKSLYKWVGSRVQYDYDKVRRYEEHGEWLEQTPEDTFKTHKGVCIDYSRLYAVMARSVGLDVKVVTGLGYDGNGGYGPHAWNEVYLQDRSGWVPLDSTWESSGGNWFDPPNFNETHIRKV